MIENAFQRDAELHALDIDIAVNDHQVKLSGTLGYNGTEDKG